MLKQNIIFNILCLQLNNTLKQGPNFYKIHESWLLNKTFLLSSYLFLTYMYLQHTTFVYLWYVYFKPSPKYKLSSAISRVQWHKEVIPYFAQMSIWYQNVQKIVGFPGNTKT